MSKIGDNVLEKEEKDYVKVNPLWRSLQMNQVYTTGVLTSIVAKNAGIAKIIVNTLYSILPFEEC